MAHKPIPSFSQRLHGRFDGMVRQEDANALAEKMAQCDGWYLLGPTLDAPPVHPVNGDAACRHLQGLLQEILTEERGVWSTMVYVQSLEDPWIIKVFHPRRAGCGCGGEGGILPWWILSRIQPEAIIAENSVVVPPPQSGKAWWKKLF